MAEYFRSVVDWIKYRSRNIIHLRVRPFLPTAGGYPKLNGEIVVYDKYKHHLLDDFAPYITPNKPDNPNFEQPLVDLMSSVTSDGDNVVIIGGGVGVSTIKASRAVGPEGSVLVYEAADDLVEVLRSTIDRNSTVAEITVDHTLVETDRKVKGSSTASHIPASELPQCDILELDCEGAEADILDAMDIRPRAIVVETHGKYGAPKDEIKDKLGTMGYEITDTIPEKPEAGIFVLAARLSS